MKLLLLLTYLFSQTTMASEATDKSWQNALSKNSITTYDQQAYCYTNLQGETEGHNVDLRVRLASVSKLLTSLWAIEKLGTHYQYQTKLFIKNKSLHIAGSLDPFFGNEKMFFLLSQLNELGYSDFETITFDKNLIVYPNAQKHTDVYPQITTATIRSNLNMYFNTNNWGKPFRDEYTRIASLSKKGKFKDHVQFAVKNVQFVESNPLENDSEARLLTYTAPELYRYLKEINVQSNNYASHTIFIQLGGEKAFTHFLKDSFDLDESKVHFFTGSGLPTTIDGTRKDNYATCSVMLKLIEELKIAVEKQNMTVEDVIAVPGSDGGTFRNRVFPADLKNSFVAKTGTLTNVSTLAGIMSTRKGYSFFGIFNETPNIIGAKKTQNTMVETIMQDLGGPLAFDYVFENFYTYNVNIKNNILDDSAISEFMPFEQGLN